MARCCEAAASACMPVRIATTLEDRFPEIVVVQPTLLAQHCAEAGLAEKAVGYWLNAGQQALDRSAMTEAVAQLRKGLDVLAGLPDGPWRRQQELDLQTALVSALTATGGEAAVDETIAPARSLAEQLGQPKNLAPLIVSQWAFHCVRAEHRLALPLGEQLEQIAAARNDATAQLLGRLLQGATRFFLGELVPAHDVLTRSLGLAEPEHRAGWKLSLIPTLGCSLISPSP